ncbi:MAG: thiamine ABC transporter substrate-binding protein [Anaerolineae bacterium]
MKHLMLFLTIVFMLAACATPTPEPTEVGPTELRVMTHDSFSISEDVIAQFEEEHNAMVQFLQAGDTGTMLNQAILTKDNPQADVIYGVDNTFLSRALEADIALPLDNLNLDQIPDNLEVDPDRRFFPMDYGDVCLNYDKAYFEENDMPVPQSLTDLTQPEYEGLLVVENPVTSSPGLAFLVTTIGVFGEDGYLDFWADLRENDVLVVDGWETAYYGEFSGGSGSEGTRPLVVSYATSPAAEVYFSEGALTEPPTGAITAPGTCFRQIEFIAVLRNTPHPELARAFVAFALGETFQADIPLNMWVYPANQRVELPQVFKDHAQTAQDPVDVRPVVIEQNREAWIEAWTETVLR